MMSDKQMTIGGRIKSLRDDKGLSIHDLSQQSGIGAEILTGIEEQEIVPPLGNIIILARTLGITVGELFGDKGDSPFCIVRSGDRKTVSRFETSTNTGGGYSYESLGLHKKNRKMEPFLVTLNPGSSRKNEPNKHSGEEILFVLEGQVEVKLESHTDILEPGDSIYYDSTMEHTVSCCGDKPATILAVIYTEQEMFIF